jgi:hypothetical protein
VKAIPLLLAIIAATATTAGAVPPGADLGHLLESESIASARVGLDAAPPGARGEIPRAPQQAGMHWLVQYDDDNQITRWLRFEVDGAETAGIAASTRQLELPLDVTAPSAHLHVEGPQQRLSDRLVVGPQARFAITAQDSSGVAASTLLLDDQELSDPGSWSRNRPDNRYVVAVRTRDALGNSGVTAATPIELTAPLRS